VLESDKIVDICKIIIYLEYNVSIFIFITLFLTYLICSNNNKKNKKNDITDLNNQYYTESNRKVTYIKFRKHLTDNIRNRYISKKHI